MTKEDKAYMIAKIFSETHNVIYFGKRYYLYNEGIWRLEDEDNTEAWIMKEYIKQHGVPPKKATVGEITQYIKMFTFEAYRKEIKYLNEQHIQESINVLSGVLDLKTLKTKPYTKEDFCFHKLPFDYTPDKKCPVMMDFLTSSMDFNLETLTDLQSEDYVKVMKFIQQWMGYSLVAGNKLEKSLIMVGEGGNGKTILLNIWKYIIGKHNSSYVDIKYLNDGTQIFMTRNKLVNFSGDLEDGQTLDTSVMKEFISAGNINANEKYKGQEPMQVSAKQVTATNDLPRIKNPNNAMLRRLHVLVWGRIFTEEEQDKDLGDKLQAEAGAIFSWAVHGLIELRKNRDFDVPDRCKFGSAKYVQNSDSIAMFIEEEDIKSEGCSVERKLVYERYNSFCRDSNLRPMGKIKFFERFEKKGFGKKRVGPNKVWHFEDVQLNSLF